MNNDINLLVTLSNGEFLLRAAIKLAGNALERDTVEYPLEPENKAKIAAFLPMHVRSFGHIVEVKEIFEVKDLTV